MAQEPDEDFDGEAEPEFESGGDDKKKLLLMIAIPLFLVVGGAAAAYFSGLADPLIAMITGEKKMTAESSRPPFDLCERTFLFFVLGP